MDRGLSSLIVVCAIVVLNCGEAVGLHREQTPSLSDPNMMDPPAWLSDPSVMGPLAPLLAAPAADGDGDGFTDLQECLGGSDSGDPDSTPEAFNLALALAGGWDTTTDSDSDMHIDLLEFLAGTNAFDPNSDPGGSVQLPPYIEFLSPSLGAQFSGELAKLAKTLDYDPLRIYAYVYNNIELERYNKSRKGALATYLTGRGNEWDQCSLLIALLRLSGVPARYVSASGVRYRPYEYPEPFCDNLSPQKQFVGVQAWMSPLPGLAAAGADDPTKTWVPLTPWLKTQQVAAGLDLFPLEVLVMDDGDPSGVTKYGSWTADTAYAGYYGAGYVKNAGASSSDYVRFTPTADAGRYAVYVCLPGEPSGRGASQVHVEVYDPSYGAEHYYISNPYAYASWHSLGACRFSGGGGAYVQIWNNPSDPNVTVADAVCFVKMDIPAELDLSDEYLNPMPPDVCFYPMDAPVDPDTKVVGDSSTMGLDGVANVALPQADGHVGRALSFTNDFITLPTTGHPFGSDHGSVSMWVNFTHGDTDCLLFGRLNSSNRLWLEVAAGRPRFFIDGGVSLAPSDPSINDGRWHHLAATWDKDAGSNGTVELYIDGQLADSGEHSQRDFAFSGAFSLGSRASGGDAYTGAMDDVRIYDRALSGEEVRDVYLGAPFEDEFAAHTQQTYLEYLQQKLVDYLAANHPGETLKGLTPAKRTVYAPASMMPMAWPGELLFAGDPNLTPLDVRHEADPNDRAYVSLRADKTGLLARYPFETVISSGQNWWWYAGAGLAPDSAGYCGGDDPNNPGVAGPAGLGNALEFIGDPNKGVMMEYRGDGAPYSLFHAAFAERSVAMWIYPYNPYAPFGQYVYDEGNSGNGLAIRVRSGKVEARVCAGDPNSTAITEKSLDPSAWQHIAVVYSPHPTDPNTKSRLRVYVDGSPGAAADYNFTEVGFHPDAAWLARACDYHAFSQYPGGDSYQGRIDDVRVYDRALSDDEITQLARDPAGEKEVLCEKKPYLTQLAGRRLTMDFEADSLLLDPNDPNTSCDVRRADLRLDGAVFHKGQPQVLTAEDEGFNLAYKSAFSPYSWQVRPTIRPDAFVQLSFDFLDGSPQLVTRLSQELAEIAAEDVLDPSSTPDERDDYLGRYARIMGATYDIRLAQDHRLSAALVHGEPEYADGIMFKAIWAYPGDPNHFGPATKDMASAFLLHPTWHMDARVESFGMLKATPPPGEPETAEDFRYLSIGATQAFVAAARLPGHGASYNEGRVFEDWQGTPALSTIAGIFAAHSDGIEVKTFEPGTDPNTIRDSLNLDGATEEQIVSEVAGGATVTTPVGVVAIKDPNTHLPLIHSDVRIVDSPSTNLIEWKYGQYGGSESIWFLDIDEYFRQGAANYIDADLGLYDAATSAIGDPVNMVTGEFYHEELPDISIRSRGVKLQLARTYKSRLIYNGPFGVGWAWSHAEQLTLDPNDPNDPNYVVYYDAERQPRQCNRIGGEYLGPPGSTFSIAKQGSDWVLTEKTGHKIIFNARGYLTEKRDTNGNRLTFELDSDWDYRITAIVDPLGRKITFTYNGNGKIIKATDFTGRSCEYGYDGDDLVWAQDLEGNTVRYEYLSGQENPTNNHNMSRCILPSGDSLRIYYYKNDTVSHHTNDKGETFHFRYSWLNHYGETWNEAGYYRKVFYNRVWDVVRVQTEDKTIETSEYDVNHNLVKFTDGNGHVTLYQYDDKRNLRAKRDACGNTSFYGYDPNYSKIAWTIDPCGVKSDYVYDPNNGNLLTSCEPNTQVIVQTDPNYPLGHWYDVQTGDPNWWLDPACDPNGSIAADERLVTSYSYDDYGNLASVTRAADDPNLAATTEYRYDVLALNLVEAVDPSGRTTRNAYDDLGRVIAVTDPAGQTVQYAYNNHDQPTLVIDQAGAVTSYVYTPLRQLLRQTNPLGGMTQYEYEPARDLVAGAKVAKVTYPLGHCETFAYDAVGNLIARTDRNGWTTEYEYDELNRPTATIDPLRKTTRQAYDGVGNVIESTNRYGGATELSYDDANQLLNRSDPLGRQIHYEYDNCGRVTKEKVATVADPNWDDTDEFFETINQYDRCGRLTVIYEGFTPEEDRRTTKRAYDCLGRLTDVTRHWPGTIGQEPNYSRISYEYDHCDNRVAETISAYVPAGGTWRTERTVSYSYDERDQVVEMVDGRGISHRYAYDAAGLQTRESVTVGSQEHHTLTDYDLAGNVVRLRKMVGGVGGAPEAATCVAETAFTYNLRGELTSQSDAVGGTRGFEYDGNGRLVAVVDEEGFVTRSYYDAIGRRIATADPLGNTTTWEHELDPNDPNSATAQAVVTPEGARTVTELNLNGEIVRRTDPIGTVVDYTYDIRGRNTQVDVTPTDAAGRTTWMAYNGFGEPTCTETWVTGEVVGIGETTIALKSVTEYDEFGRAVKIIDLRQRVVDPSAPSYVEVFRSETHRAYDVLDQVVRVAEAADPNDGLAASDYAYDGNGHLVAEIRYLAGEGQPVALASRLSEDTLRALGEPNAATTLLDPNRDAMIVTRWVYDSLNRETQHVDAWELDANAQTRTTAYDDTARRMVEADPFGIAAAVEYDKAGRKTTQGYWTGLAVGAGATQFDYDRRGLVTEVSRSGIYPLKNTYDEVGRVTHVYRGNDLLSEQTYDRDSRVESRREHRSAETNYQTAFDYDFAGRVTCLTEAVDDPNEVQTGYTYDGFGNLRTIVDGRFYGAADPNDPNDPNVAARYVYDNLDRCVTDYDAGGVNDGDAETSLYDRFDPGEPNLRFAETTLRDGVVVRRAYDRLGRLARVEVDPNDGGGFGIEQTFTYDSLSRMITAVDYNGDYSGGSKARAVQYAYDKFSRTISEDNGTVSGPQRDFFGEFDVTTAYAALPADPNFSLCKTVTYGDPNGADMVVERRYDTRGRLGQVRESGGTVFAEYGYDDLDRLTTTDFANGVQLKIDYEVSYGREENRYYGNGDPSVYRMATTYDRQGNVGTETIRYRDDGQFTRNYAYDALGRLTAQVQAGEPNVAWMLDAVGNWSATTNYPDSSASTVTRVASVENEYTSISSEPNAPVYDARGNITERNGLWRYTYDWANRLIEVECYDGGWETAAEYQYDAVGRRVIKLLNASGVWRRYVYDGSNNVRVYTAGGMVRSTVFGRRVDEPVVKIDGGTGQQVYYAADRIGSIAALTDATGAVVEMYDYTAYGVMTIMDPNGDEISASAYGNTLGYTCRPFDSESGLWHYRTRSYDPSLGRFCQRDRAGYADGVNLYAYVRNNPLRYTDPTGRTARRAGESFAGAVNWVNQTYSAGMARRADQAALRSTFSWPAPRNPASAWADMLTEVSFGDMLPPRRTIFDEIASDVTGRWGDPAMREMARYMPRPPGSTDGSEYEFMIPTGVQVLRSQYQYRYPQQEPETWGEKAFLFTLGATQEAKRIGTGIQRRTLSYYGNPLLTVRDAKDLFVAGVCHVGTSIEEGYKAGTANRAQGGGRASSMWLAARVTMANYAGGRQLYAAAYGEDYYTGEKISWQDRGARTVRWAGGVTSTLLVAEKAANLVTRPKMQVVAVPRDPLASVPRVDLKKVPVVYRGDERLQGVLSEGFYARGWSLDLRKHLHDNTNPPSAFVSTTKDFDFAASISNYVYAIRPRNGIDVNAVLNRNSPMMEVAIPYHVAPQDIIGVTILSPDGSGADDWIPNPFFDPDYNP